MFFFLDQHGCAKNQVDAELLLGILCEKGWTQTDVPENSDLIIVNSCGFIESAKVESLNAVITARAAYPKAKVLLSGCLAERYATSLESGLPEADAFFGNGDLSRLPEILESLFPSSPSAPSSRPVIVPDQKGVCAGMRPQLLSFPRSAYVKITEGCDNWCSFCAIPLIRGALRSRSVEDIVNECRELISRGIYEINLIGQDLAAFGCGSEDINPSPLPSSDLSVLSSNPSPLSLLLLALSALKGNFIVRLLYIHPDHFPRDILPVMTADTRFLPYFDMPFQAGDDKLIAAMNRKGNTASYKKLVQDVRSAFSKADTPYDMVAIRTTFLVGFPGETDESFENTALFLSDIRSLWSGCFTWSREEDTVAAEMKKRVPKKKAQARMERLQEIQIGITPEELAVFVNKTLKVLVEECIPDALASSDAPALEVAIPDTHLALGRAWFQAPDVDGSIVLQYEDGQRDIDGGVIAPGSVVMARVIAVNGVDLEAVAL